MAPRLPPFQQLQLTFPRLATQLCTQTKVFYSNRVQNNSLNHSQHLQLLVGVADDDDATGTLLIVVVFKEIILDTVASYAPVSARLLGESLLIQDDVGT